MQSFTLSPNHYAANWPTLGDTKVKNDRDVINALAIEYAVMPDSQKKEDLFLELIRYFHGYLMKFVTMVVRGTIPSMKSAAGKDAMAFLNQIHDKTLGTDIEAYMKTCRMLHLAFKEMTSDDVYDVMAECFMRATRKYDPLYTKKVSQLCKVINGKYRFRKDFTTDDLSASVGFNTSRILRMLVGKHYLASIHGPRKKVLGYTRGPEWPPDKKFLSASPIGFTYYVRRWFKMYLEEYVERTMDTIEARGDIMQLEHRTANGDSTGGVDGQFDMALPHADGNYTDYDGARWLVDTALMSRNLDLSDMTDEWVRHTNDRLFRKLTSMERKLLQLVYRYELPWQEAGTVLNITGEWTKKKFLEILRYLRGRAGTIEQPVELAA